MGVLSFLSGGADKFVSGLFDGVTSILEQTVTTDKDRLKVKAELLKLELGFKADLAKAEAEFAKSQAAIITAEANSQSWAARNWRPIVMLIFAFIMAWNFILAPLFELPITDVPPDMYRLLEIGLGGYIVMETAKHFKSPKKVHKD